VTAEPTGRQRRPARTWSLLGDVRRKPSQYEVVTAKFHYHFRREPAPFELDPSTPINEWYLKHREGSPFQVEDWEQFRDPRRLTYRDYVSMQDEHEIYVDHLVDRAEQEDVASRYSPEWVATLRSFLIPIRFPLHVLQITALYVGQLAPSSFITNCANFQAADEMRRIQRIAYWTKVIANAHGDELAGTEVARSAWEQGEAWQPLRRTMEELLVTFDWGEAFAALNLAVKPALDAVLDWQFAAVAKLNEDDLLNPLLTEFQLDAERSREWTAALVRYAVEHSPGTADVLRQWVATWRPKAEAACTPLVALQSSATAPATAPAAAGPAAARLDAIIADCGL
jgi:toluene monooxygenase system protein E